MNKYQEALNEIRKKYQQECKCCFASSCNDKCHVYSTKNLLHEVFEKATPKKVKIFIAFGERLCPNCRNHMIDLYKYCPDCGQALDWSGEYER